MTTAEKLDILTELIARKDLDTWCLVKTMFTEDRELYIKEHRSKPITIIKWNFFDYFSQSPEPHDIKSIIYVDYMQDICLLADAEDYIIIWHPVLLSDVLVWLNKIWAEYVISPKWLWFINYGTNTIEFERDLTKPYLSEQNSEVIDWLYEVSLLIKKD